MKEHETRLSKQWLGTDCQFIVMVYKISEKPWAIQAPQEMFSVCNEGCVVSGADGVLEEFRC